MSYQTLLRSLGYEGFCTTVPKEANFYHRDVEVEPTQTQGDFCITCGSGIWYLQSKITLTTEQLNAVACICMRFAPSNSITSLQADTHGAGNVFVGMIMTFYTERIPINLVSGDIGCGLTVIPLVSPENSHVKLKGDDFHSYVLSVMRASLVRGRRAEEGFSLNKYLKEACQFYGEDELGPWLDQLSYVLRTAGFDIHAKPERPSWAVDEKEENYELDPSLTGDQNDVLRYVGRFAQSLGSSGNHFMELATDDQDYYWLVIHSGSRGLGAKVYDVVAQACRVLNDGLEIATGRLAEFYAIAYDALNKFAKLNRVLCAMAVLKNLKVFSYSTQELKRVMSQSFLFAPAIVKSSGDENAVLSLLSGLTHNGIKAFVNDRDRQVLYVLSKGAVAMTKRAAASIVALRAGDGCYLWTLADPTIPWKEEDVRIAISKHYSTIYHTEDVIYSGHGAGRSQSSTKTEKASTFQDLMDFYRENGIAGNIAPGVLGDNPRIAYKPIDEIISHLPLDIACTKSLLKTRVSYKEGLCYKTDMKKKCTEYIKSQWETTSPMQRLWFDIELCQGQGWGFTKSEIEIMQTQQKECIDKYLASAQV